MRRKLLPFVAATILGVGLAAIVAAADWSMAVALSLGTIALSVLAATSIPYAFGRRESSAREHVNGQPRPDEPPVVVVLRGRLAESRPQSRTNRTDADLVVH